MDLFRYHSAEAEFEIFQVLSASKLADKKEKIAEGIVKHYKLGWDYGGTYYKTVAILEQINFILEMKLFKPFLIIRNCASKTFRHFCRRLNHLIKNKYEKRKHYSRIKWCVECH